MTINLVLIVDQRISQEKKMTDELQSVKGIVVSCEHKPTASGKDRQLIRLKDDTATYTYWSKDGFKVGEEIEFTYEFNEQFKSYNVKSILSDMKGITHYEEDRLRKIISEILNVDMSKLLLENDRRNRHAILLKCAFDYGVPRKMEWLDIIELSNTLLIIIGDKTEIKEIKTQPEVEVAKEVKE